MEFFILQFKGPCTSISPPSPCPLSTSRYTCPITSRKNTFTETIGSGNPGKLLLSCHHAWPASQAACSAWAKPSPWLDSRRSAVVLLTTQAWRPARRIFCYRCKVKLSLPEEKKRDYIRSWAGGKRRRQCSSCEPCPGLVPDRGGLLSGGRLHTISSRPYSSQASQSLHLSPCKTYIYCSDRPWLHARMALARVYSLLDLQSERSTNSRSGYEATRRKGGTQAVPSEASLYAASAQKQDQLDMTDASPVDACQKRKHFIKRHN